MIYAENKKAFFDYQILETFEAGIELKGYEAKAITSGKINITGSYAVIKNGEIFLINADVPPYQKENTPLSYNQKRDRKLLMKKQEIAYLYGKAKGLTIIPLKFYNKKSKIKVELALARRKQKKDKRQKIKNREAEKEIRRVKN